LTDTVESGLHFSTDSIDPSSLKCLLRALKIGYFNYARVTFRPFKVIQGH